MPRNKQTCIELHSEITKSVFRIGYVNEDIQKKEALEDVANKRAELLAHPSNNSLHEKLSILAEAKEHVVQYPVVCFDIPILQYYRNIEKMSKLNTHSALQAAQLSNLQSIVQKTPKFPNTECFVDAYEKYY